MNNLSDDYLDAITNLSNELKKIRSFNNEISDIKSNHLTETFIKMNDDVINGKFKLELPEINDLDIKSALEYNADIYAKIKSVEVAENPDSASLAVNAVDASIDHSNTKEGKTFEDVIERSRELGLTLPKNQMELIRVSIEENKIPIKTHLDQIEKIAEKHSEKGLSWCIREDHNPKYPILYYVDKNSSINAYVIERTNKETQERFFVANRINNNGEHLKIASNSSLDAIRNNVAAYYTGATIREIAIEISKMPDKQSSKDKEAKKAHSPELSLS